MILLSCKGFVAIYDSDIVFNKNIASVLTNAEASTSALLLDDDHVMLNIVSESQTGDSLMEPTVAEQPDKKPAGAQF